MGVRKSSNRSHPTEAIQGEAAPTFEYQTAATSAIDTVAVTLQDEAVSKELTPGSRLFDMEKVEQGGRE
jgi:hypothetical protein